ncbi:MAG: hypothetical protein MUF07_06920 [Steroidobacteraceae bacterium]|jgi:hypothetical protein|nr:hypothetical protein [Steroidobacteraceae bacterium]
MLPRPGFQCRVCSSPDFVAVGKSRLGAKFYACAGCSAVFMDPGKWSKPAHEQAVPGLAHLSPRLDRRREGEG